MDLELAGRTAVVVAASQGLGKAVALRLAEEGATVVMCARKQDTIDAAAQDIRRQSGNGNVLAVAADVTDKLDIANLARRVADETPGADILINNAGGPPPGLFDDLDDEKWQLAVDLTLMSAVRLTRAFLPHMRKQRWGRIVNMTSFSVKQPVQQLMLSNSIRLAVVGWAKTLANEVAPDNVLVNNVCPGWISTDRVGQLLAARADSQHRTVEDVSGDILATIPMGRMGKPEEFADVVAFLSSARASYISGVSLSVDGGAVQSPL